MIDALQLATFSCASMAGSMAGVYLFFRMMADREED